jgi:hypothetical protein
MLDFEILKRRISILMDMSTPKMAIKLLLIMKK